MERSNLFGQDRMSLKSTTCKMHFLLLMRTCGSHPVSTGTHKAPFMNTSLVFFGYRLHFYEFLEQEHQ